MQQRCIGDNYNVQCPHCNKINHYVSCGLIFTFGKITRFNRACSHCKKMIYYHGNYEIKITAYLEDSTLFISNLPKK